MRRMVAQRDSGQWASWAATRARPYGIPPCNGRFLEDDTSRRGVPLWPPSSLCQEPRAGTEPCPYRIPPFNGRFLEDDTSRRGVPLWPPSSLCQEPRAGTEPCPYGIRLLYP